MAGFKNKSGGTPTLCLNFLFIYSFGNAYFLFTDLFNCSIRGRSVDVAHQIEIVGMLFGNNFRSVNHGDHSDT